MESMILIIDGENRCTLVDLIKANSEPDVTPLADEDVKMIEGLKVGEYVHVGVTKIERVEA